MKDKELIFALDIGTRSVVGVLIENSQDGLQLLEAEIEEHQNRAMLDGQIHDIDQVSTVVKNIKERLEKKINFKLKGVAVAAAGRALKTQRAQARRDTVLFNEITREDVLSLELEAVQIAQSNLLDEFSNDLKYHCVGYSVVHSYLNNNKIGNLVGQQGEEIAVEVLATFLPREVVDSLFAVLDRVNLEMTSLTLEPIAASQVVVPPSMRQLCVALVDVGAGTSDIAITAEGTIAAYAMVPEAGDEITEAICEEFILDFNEGEKVKRQINASEQIKFSDILGITHSVSKQKILEQIAPKVSELANKISEKITSLSPKPVQAVLFIGGGALTPLLPQKVAEFMGLSSQRVGIRARDVVKDVKGDLSNLMGPDSITPLGIGVVAHLDKGLRFSKVYVNSRPIRIFELNKGTVADALLASGVSMRKIYGKPGLALTLTINGQFRMIKGQHGKPAVITVNGQKANIDTAINPEDEVCISTAEDGANASAVIADIVENLEPLEIIINHSLVVIKPIITMNGSVVSPETAVEDRAEILVYRPKNVGQALEMAGLENYLINQYIIKLNGTKVDSTSIITSQDILEIESLENSTELLKDEKDSTKELSSNHIEVLVNNEIIRVEKNAKQVMFVDLLNYIKISATPPKPGAHLRMQLNGMSAEFTSVIKSGDQIVIDWF